MFELVTLLLLSHCCEGARKLRGNQDSARGAKSLVNSFPFNAQDDHHAAHEPSQSLNTRIARQGEDEVAVGLKAVAAAAPGDDGKKCFDKVEMIEESE